MSFTSLLDIKMTKSFQMVFNTIYSIVDVVDGASFKGVQQFDGFFDNIEYIEKLKV